MARKRMIDPEFWSDEKISKLAPEARLLFIGLWNYADDEGIFKNHPSLLASEIFPYEKNFAEKVERYLQSIEEQNLIFAYNRDGQGYGIVLNFGKHQSISHPQPSKLPRPSMQNPKYKNAIFRRDNFICAYCRKELRWDTKYPQDRPTIDHVVPREKGGGDLPVNLVTACEKCNKGKCDMDADEFCEHSVNNQGTFLPSISKVNIREVNIREVKLIEDVLIDLNQILKTSYKSSSVKTKELIQSRINEGATLDDFKTVHRKMAKAWGMDNKMRQFLRPITLYGNKFESYLNRPDDIRELTSAQQSNLKQLQDFRKENKNDESSV